LPYFHMALPYFHMALPCANAIAPLGLFCYCDN
jgi:hypothetical protein